jgi:hypothetical protein
MSVGAPPPLPLNNVFFVGPVGTCALAGVAAAAWPPVAIAISASPARPAVCESESQLRTSAFARRFARDSSQGARRARRAREHAREPTQYPSSSTKVK